MEDDIRTWEVDDEIETIMTSVNFLTTNPFTPTPETKAEEI
jgi:hypothetical protein